MAQATASASDQTSRGAGGLATQTVTLSAATANSSSGIIEPRMQRAFARSITQSLTPGVPL